MFFLLVLLVIYLSSSFASHSHYGRHRRVLLSFLLCTFCTFCTFCTIKNLHGTFDTLDTFVNSSPIHPQSIIGPFPIDNHFSAWSFFHLAWYFFYLVPFTSAWSFLSYFCFGTFCTFHYFIGPMSSHSRSILGPLSIDLFSFLDHFGSFWTNPQMFYFVFFSEHGPVMIPFQCCILPYIHTRKSADLELLTYKPRSSHYL